MKVVLFCGGLGMRMRDYSDSIPKPMVPVGSRPILWHVMRYYAHYGHKDFILCLGYRGETIKNFFLNYNEAVSNDFILSQGGKNVELLSTDISDWKITFVDTGLESNIGMRLKAVERHLQGESMFLANYSDGLSDVALPEQLAHFQATDHVASFLCVKPNLTLHFVAMDGNGKIHSIRSANQQDLRINGGFFIFRSEIFRYIKPGEELLLEPFHRLLDEGRLCAYRHDGFWMPMDTFKDREHLDELTRRGRAPWEVWR
ncbi:MAG TPA: sugar phosphate nucleotidyltransferase [Candidatus Polarisedimenticolaceae bacterium]|nr:sugar phosphate nucleotidyltransferase [Candidatus Polarisedimenticolaceae bacterium]